MSALRRASALVERVRDDGSEDADLDELGSCIEAVRRAAAAGYRLDASALDHLQRVLARTSRSALPPESTYDLLRTNALAETHSLLRRLRHLCEASGKSETLMPRARAGGRSPKPSS